MAFEKGNKHGVGSKPRLFDAALRRAIAQDDSDRVRKAAEELLTLAANGEQWALKELADRLDGKAQQNVSIERKDVRDLSLAELAAAMAAELDSGSTSQNAGAESASGLH
jgi:gamma-glutamyl phosphate reductase